MGVDNCNCKSNETNQASIVHNAPEKQDACKMFSQKYASSVELDWSMNGAVQKQTVYRGFAEDANVKIRLIENTQKAQITVTPQVKKFKEHLKPELTEKLDELEQKDAFEEWVALEDISCN